MTKTFTACYPQHPLRVRAHSPDRLSRRHRQQGSSFADHDVTHRGYDPVIILDRERCRDLLSIEPQVHVHQRPGWRTRAGRGSSASRDWRTSRPSPAQALARGAGPAGDTIPYGSLLKMSQSQSRSSPERYTIPTNSPPTGIPTGSGAVRSPWLAYSPRANNDATHSGSSRWSCAMALGYSLSSSKAWPRSASPPKPDRLSCLSSFRTAADNSVYSGFASTLDWTFTTADVFAKPATEAKHLNTGAMFGIRDAVAVRHT